MVWITRSFFITLYLHIQVTYIICSQATSTTIVVNNVQSRCSTFLTPDCTTNTFHFIFAKTISCGFLFTGSSYVTLAYILIVLYQAPSLSFIRLKICLSAQFFLTQIEVRTFNDHAHFLIDCRMV